MPPTVPAIHPVTPALGPVSKERNLSQQQHEPAIHPVTPALGPVSKERNLSQQQHEPSSATLGDSDDRWKAAPVDGKQATRNSPKSVWTADEMPRGVGKAKKSNSNNKSKEGELPPSSALATDACEQVRQQILSNYGLPSSTLHPGRSTIGSARFSGGGFVPYQRSTEDLGGGGSSSMPGAAAGPTRLGRLQRSDDANCDEGEGEGSSPKGSDGFGSYHQRRNGKDDDELKQCSPSAVDVNLNVVPCTMSNVKSEGFIAYHNRAVAGDAAAAGLVDEELRQQEGAIAHDGDAAAMSNKMDTHSTTPLKKRASLRREIPIPSE
eukprot:TRINITY_DN11376_c0_g3_i2.p1 TRINITY_DN11376_c0_g3~~TRINITY_DN11376_c0_g3_i2.p1  ORF type:complete len:376 (-),score=83.27 TRINITY_DN11376_c0_g3_i2:612-1577(-)